MTITFDTSLANFPFTGDAAKFARTLSRDEFDAIEQYLDDCGTTFSYEEINNFFIGEQNFIRETILKGTA